MNISSSDGIVLIEDADPPSSWVVALCGLFLLTMSAYFAWAHRHVTYATDYWEVMHGKYGDYVASARANKINAITFVTFIAVLLAAAWLLGTISGVGQGQLAADLIKTHPAQPLPFGWKQLTLLLLMISALALLFGPHLVAAPH